MRPVALVVLVGLASLAASPGQATAETVIIPDPSPAERGDGQEGGGGEGDGELSAAVSLLVRSSLQAGQRSLVPRRQLALALEAVTGRSPGKMLVVPAAQAAKVVEQLGADSIVLWEVASGQKGTRVGGTLVGANGKRLLRISATAASGDVSVLARQLARRIAPAIGATVIATPELGLADLRPVLQAQGALAVQDGVAITRALDLVLPKVAAQLVGAKQLLQDIAADPGLTSLPRTQALLLLGDWDLALERADAGLASDAKNILLRAAKVRALAARQEFAAAERELQALKAARTPSVLALAQVALALARGDSRDKLAEALSPLVGRPAADWRPILPLMAAAAPGSFGERGEALALAAAHKLAQQEPGLATTLAARALLGGAKAEEAAPLIKVQELSAEQVQSVSTRLGDDGGAAAVLSERIKAREEEAKAVAAAGPDKPTGSPSALASNLRGVLQDFAALYDPKLTSVAIAPLPGSGQPFYWPYLIRKQQLGAGLTEALMRSPWELQATTAKLQTEAMPPDRFTDEGMATLAHDIGDGAVLFYRVRPAGLAPWVTLELFLFDSAHQRIERIDTSMAGRSTGLMVLSPLWLGAFVLACLAVLGWAIRMSLRGTIVVRVQWDSDAKDELFTILLSRRAHTPTIDNVGAYRKTMEWIGKRKRHYQAWNIDQTTTFRAIPRGQWHVHLYGIYTRGRQTLLLREPPQLAEVEPRKTTFVVHVLEAAEAEFKITVVDDHGPVEGARVWLDESRASAAASAKDGSVTLKVPKGYHVIHVSARGMDVERPYHVIKAKVHEMTINLVWEKRQDYVSRALERQVDEAVAYSTKPAQKRPAPTSFSLAPAPQQAPPVGPGAGAPPVEQFVDRATEPRAGAPAAADAIEIQLEDAPKAVVARPTLTLKPLVPSTAAGPSAQAAAATSDAATVGQAVDLNMVPEPDVPVDLPPVDLVSPGAPAPEVPPILPSPNLPSPNLPSPDLPSPDSPSPDLLSPDLPSPDLPSPDLPSPDLPSLPPSARARRR